MVFLNTLQISIAIFIPLALFFLMVYLFMEKLYLKKLTIENRIDLVELFGAIDLIIATEAALYEQYLRINSDIDITKITNEEFINIYNDLSMRCLRAVSPQFWESAELYMDREAIQTYITEKVLQYLTDKIGT